jgi:hypothetical protein
MVTLIWQPEGLRQAPSQAFSLEDKSNRVPGALPWAKVSDPFGVKTKSPHDPAGFGGSAGGGGGFGGAAFFAPCSSGFLGPRSLMLTISTTSANAIAA